MAARTRGERESHRKFAVDLFNLAWTLMETKRRTRERDLRMIHAAHASRYHWEQVGTPKNLAIGEWQVSRVYAILRRAEPALFHARACLGICRRHGLRDFPLAYAYEALARASAVAGDRRGRGRYLRLAERAGRGVREPEDRALLLEDLRTVP